MGSDRGLETKLVPAAGFELLALPARPLYGQSLIDRARAVPAMVNACWSAWKALGSFGADFVISVGGYASVPAVIAAVLRRVRIALVEPNAVPGRANRAAARAASSFSSSKRNWFFRMPARPIAFAVSEYRCARGW
jgi:UDP-N-acetylglucosamine--N-acetylmuramyl-(pentapeptide) pyrophosphoryl-undecaprenol N-acetylglucosamine transferase